MSDQHGFGMLQMGVSGHGCAAGFLRAIAERFADLGQLASQFVDCRARIEAQIGGDLFVAAAATMQFESPLADSSHQLLFDEMMDVFRFFVFHETLRHIGRVADLLQSLKNGDELVGGQNPGVFQSMGMSGARRQFVTEQPTVEIKRSLPAFELRIQRLPKAARPHLHRTTSVRARARVRDGSPRMRMKPSASF